MKWRSKDGNWQVEDITLALTGDGRDGHWLRLSYCGYFVAECRTVAELRQYLDPADLHEALTVSPARGEAAALADVQGSPGYRWYSMGSTLVIVRRCRVAGWCGPRPG